MIKSSLATLTILLGALFLSNLCRPAEARSIGFAHFEDEPSLDEVRHAVLTYFGNDEEANLAKQNLVRWGNAALPALRSLAMSKLGARQGHALTVCIETETTQESVELLVDILRGETQIEASYSLSALQFCGENHKLRRYLRKNDDFKPAAVVFAESGSWLERSHFAKIAAVMKWKDCIPLIEEMLEHENQSLRISAAEALTKLTGEPVAAKRSEASFPKRQLHPDLLGAARTLRDHADAKGQFSYDFEGQPALLLSESKRLDVFAAGERVASTRDLEFYCMRMLTLPGKDGVNYVLTASSQEPWGDGDFISAVDREGATLWTYQPEKSRVQGLAPLRTPDGLVGSVVAAGSKLYALDHSGELLWKCDPFTPTYDLLSHPELPGLLYTIHGQLGRFRITRESCKFAGLPIRAKLYAGHGQLFPDREGRAALILAGAGKNSVPTVARVAEDGKTLWSATLPGRVGGLAMLEAPGKPRLFVLTCDSGQLFVIDAAGTLLHEQPLPDIASSGPTSTYGLSAGQLSPGEWGIHLKLLSKCYLYSVDFSVL